MTTILLQNEKVGDLPKKKRKKRGKSWYYSRMWKWYHYYNTNSLIFIPELQALLWATKIVRSEGWQNVVWSSDSKLLVSEINDGAEPCRWETRIGILQVKEISPSFKWLFVWNARSANLSADCVAKYSLSNECCLYLDSFSLSIPPSILSMLSDEKEGGAAL